MERTLVLKKSIGTSLLIAAILSLLLVFSGQANALLNFFNNDLTFTATVTQVGGSSFQVDKGGTYPFTIVSDSSTSYSGDLTGLADLEIGDNVLVASRESQGMLVANSVEPVTSDTYGYGSGCEVFQGSELWVSAIEDGILFLSRANITFEVAYDGNTEVMPGSQSVSDLTVGETIAITGSDCNADGLTADVIVRNMMPEVDPNAVSCSNYEGIITYNTQVLLSHDAGGAFTPLRDVTVPAGTYDVYGVSFDHHSSNAWDTHTNEAWYVEGYTSGGLSYTSMATADLPDGIDRNATMIGSGVTVASDIDQLRFVHNAYVDATYQSILPECVVFVPQTTPVAPPITPVAPLVPDEG